MADAKSSQKWADANRAILAALDIEAEYRRIGLRIDGPGRARATGWMPCHAMGREDANASAEINVGDGDARGRYRDFGGGGESMSLFDFAAKYGSGFGGDWKQARNHFARQTGVKLPKDAEQRDADKFEFFDLTPGTLLLWSKSKPVITAAAVMAAGGRGARWPLKLPAELTQHLITFPCFGGSLLDLEPVGFHSANSAPGRPVSIYKGKGVPPDLVKTMQTGPPGLMNVHALRRLPEAKVVWVVEGLSDMLALQTALLSMPDDLGHVVITAGGASYHPKPEWMQHFAGKDVRVCFDLDKPDPQTGKRAGEVGAKVWVGALVKVAAAVRNVALPFIDGSGKKDVRDYLQDHTYNDLWELSETFPVIADQPEAGANGHAVSADGQALTPHQAMLAQFGIIVSGSVEHTEWIEVFSTATHKKTLIKDIDRLTVPKANLFFGGKICEQYLNPGLEAMPGKYKVRDLQVAIAAEAAGHYLSEEPDRGCGIWKVGERLVLVGPRAAEVWDGETLTPIETPALDGQRLDFGGQRWYDRETLIRNLEAAKDTAWCQEVIHGANKLFGRWENWHNYATTPQLITGLVAATWVQTIWEVRPQVCIVGMTNSGKSFLLNECLKKMFGPLGLWIDKPSEAAIRQRLGHTARLLLIDEFENDEKNRQRVLEMMRVSSRGGQIGRGTSNSQKGVLFPLRHMSWTAAKNFKLTDAADRNRFIILNLDALPDGHVARLQMPEDEVLEAFGQRLLAIAIRYSRCAAKMAGEMKRYKAWGVDNRTAEIHAVPISLLACAQGWSTEAAIGFLEEVLGEHKKDKPAEDDREQLIRDILESVVHLGRGGKTTVSALLWDQVIEDGTGHAIDKDEALATVGIKTINELPRKLFLSPRMLTRGILKDSDFSKSDLTQILTQIPDAEQVRQRVGIHQSRGVLIPFSYFAANREQKGEF